MNHWWSRYPETRWQRQQDNLAPIRGIINGLVFCVAAWLIAWLLLAAPWPEVLM